MRPNRSPAPLNLLARNSLGDPFRYISKVIVFAATRSKRFLNEFVHHFKLYLRGSEAMKSDADFQERYRNSTTEQFLR